MSRTETNSGGIHRIVAVVSRMATSASAARTEEPVTSRPAVTPPTESPQTPITNPGQEPELQPGQHASPELGEWIDNGVQVEIDRREQERIARQGRIAGAD